MPRNRSEKYSPEQQAMIDFRDAAIAQFRKWGVPLNTTWAVARALSSGDDESPDRERASKAWLDIAPQDRALISSCVGLEESIKYIDRILP